MTFFVYILFSERLDRYYVGTTDDVVKRLKKHNSKHYPSAFTSKGIPWDLELQIPCNSSNIAYQLENFIKPELCVRIDKRRTCVFDLGEYSIKPGPSFAR